MLVTFQNFLTLPLLLSIVSIILPPLVAPSTSSPWNHSRPSNGFNTDDYNDDYDTETTTRPVDPVAKRCKYDLCQEQQPTCQELAASSGCSCPGMSGPNETPDPPTLRKLSQEGSGGVVVYWCAPASTVTHYVVQVKGREGELTAGERRRQLDLGEVEAGTEVCVQAVNRVGVSDRAKHSCTRFQPQSSESVLALKLGIIGGVVTLIVVLVLALLLWRLRIRRKTLARTENGGAEGML
ncbi:leucine-rich repeat neuronal protein 4-like [Astyanax mexicanus]|uniref:Leucine-rich repeat neuronal protein 4-like n=1 Tax=Astyanax mexicanus TaxID=7994 RepID=A0A8T2MKW7_ASTMX|nr:leucine-rich repeat neuronal protein 4-like [Astyanax mexicanus]